jgi:hypothetical protein
MDIISDRISILKKPGLLSIVILPTTDRRKLALMFFWLLAWSACGVIVITSYFSLTDRDARLFVIVYLSFWAYFEVSILRAFMWKKFGKEKLWISKGTFNYQREVAGRGKIKSHHLDLVSPLQLIELRPTNFFDNLSQSFWVKGGERLELQAHGKTYRLGMQLSDEEARTVLKEVNGFMKSGAGNAVN